VSGVVDAAGAIARFRPGETDAASMMSALRAGVLLVPVTASGQVLVGRARGASWLYVFTGRDELVRFAAVSAEGTGLDGFVVVRGSRLLDEVVADLPVVCGVAIDVAGRSPMLLPPLPSVLPAAFRCVGLAGRAPQGVGA
jgi:hypothetical protein